MHTRSIARHTIAVAALACLAAPHAAHAQFLGTSATGGIFFSGSSINYFDPANGYVPNGYSNNAQGTTVTVTEPAIEFGFMSFSNTDTVNITANTITLTDVTPNAVSTLPLLVTLTDTAFAGFTFTATTNTSSGSTFSQSGNTLNLNFASFLTAGTRTLVLTASPAVPEPGSVALLAGLCVTGAGFLRKRRVTA